MNHLKYDTAMIIIIVFASITQADSWGPPRSSVTYSDNNKYSALVTPADPNNSATLEVFRELSTTKNEPPIDSLSEKESFNMTRDQYTSFWKRAYEEWKKHKNRKLLWKTSLTNDTSPLDVLISNDGESVVTLDNFYSVGYGNDVIAFYNKNGQIKQYSLKEAIQGIPLLPEPEEEELRELMGDDYEEVDSLLFAKNPPFDRSVSSLWWRQKGTTLLYETDGKSFLCIWLDWADKWLSWDLTTGQECKTVDELLPQMTDKACEIFRKELDDFDGYWYPFVEAPILFLAKQKHAEDRIRIEKLLQDECFNTSCPYSDKKLICFSAESDIRKPADWSLSMWDGKIKSTEKYDEYSDYTYFFLGNVSGSVILPEKPKETDNVWVYLIPPNISESNWKQYTPIHILRMSFDNPRIIYDKKMPFEIHGVTPGSYWIKCVWDRSEPYAKDWPDTQIKPSKGDYESTGRIDIRIEAGKKVGNIIIEKFVEVK